MGNLAGDGDSTTFWCRELVTKYTSKKLRCKTGKISGPSDVWRMMQSMAAFTEEEFRVLLLDGRHKPLGWQMISRGTATASLVHPMQVFRAAIAKNATSLILVHNHPTGDASPSKEDREITDRLRKAGELLGITVHDHVIIGASEFNSAREGGWYE